RRSAEPVSPRVGRGPPSYAIDLDRDDRPRGQALDVGRVLRGQRGERTFSFDGRRHLAREPRDAHPPELRPILVVTIDLELDRGMRADVHETLELATPF